MNPNGLYSSPHSSLPLATEQQLDSDDGAGQCQSGDDAENEYDDQHENARNGKRKRPISVSYVSSTLFPLSLPPPKMHLLSFGHMCYPLPFSSLPSKARLATQEHFGLCLCLYSRFRLHHHYQHLLLIRFPTRLNTSDRLPFSLLLQQKRNPLLMRRPSPDANCASRER